MVPCCSATTPSHYGCCRPIVRTRSTFPGCRSSWVPSGRIFILASWADTISRPSGPTFWGQKISFKPTENLEMGFTRNAVFAGEGHVPLTFASFWRSFTSFNDATAAVKFSRNDPGARHASFDFYYRIPRLRHWLTIYMDSVVHDDVSPVSAPSRSGINPGIYLTHFPGLPKLEFRAEAVSTNPPVPQSNGGYFIYYEVVYHSLYVNNKNLIGSWIGREGNGYQAWTTYVLSPKSSVQAAFRYSKIAKDFLPQGSTQVDANLSAILRVQKNVELRSFLQYESWLIPVLNPTRQHDVAASLQVTCGQAWAGSARSSNSFPRSAPAETFQHDTLSQGLHRKMQPFRFD